MREEKKLILIVPCYNEEEVVGYTAEVLLEKINSLIEKNLVSSDSGICFVNDGSRDKTPEILDKLAETNSRVAVINLSRNFGHQYAILAGMKTVDADMIITLDADLQDSVDSIDEMISKYHAGYEIVYGCREKRLGDDILKKTTALVFYKIMKFLCPNLYYNHADFRLMSRKALSLFNDFNEKVVFLRGLIPNIGLKSTTVTYNRTARLKGTPKYNYARMFELAWRGITNYSVFPLRLILIIGVLLIVLALITFILLSLSKAQNIPAFLVAFMSFFCGLSMLSMGILGEYIAKILFEVKGRPSFQIDNTKNI